ncbi:hypothetical protein SAMN06272735_9165 [Streptomyces sp. TLI_55]|nr:hypothetical protein SAMN06272735_9165 [Streptomyces sp. TLI_55]
MGRHGVNTRPDALMRPGRRAKPPHAAQAFVTAHRTAPRCRPPGPDLAAAETLSRIRTALPACIVGVEHTPGHRWHRPAGCGGRTAAAACEAGVFTRIDGSAARTRSHGCIRDRDSSVRCWPAGCGRASVGGDGFACRQPVCHREPRHHAHSGACDPHRIGSDTARRGAGRPPAHPGRARGHLTRRLPGRPARRAARLGLRTLLRADATRIGRTRRHTVFPGTSQVRAIGQLRWAGADLRIRGWHVTRTHTKGAPEWAQQ